MGISSTTNQLGSMYIYFSIVDVETLKIWVKIEKNKEWKRE